MLELRRVSKSYLSIPAVRSVSFTVNSGEVTGYLGPNGSGKSTTLKMIAGLIQPDDGLILLDGEPLARDAFAIRNRIGYVPEEAHLYTHLTGREYLLMVGQLRGLDDDTLDRKVDGFLRLFNLSEDRHGQITGIRRACGRRCFSPRRFCTTRTCCCSMNHSRAST